MRPSKLKQKKTQHKFQQLKTYNKQSPQSKQERHSRQTTKKTKLTTSTTIKDNTHHNKHNPGEESLNSEEESKTIFLTSQTKRLHIIPNSPKPITNIEVDTNDPIPKLSVRNFKGK